MDHSKWIVEPIPAFKDNYIWLLRQENNVSVIVVDPGDAKPVLAKLKQEQLTLAAVLVTHHHWDHSNGILELLQFYNAQVFGPAKENINGITDPVAESMDIVISNLDLKFGVLDIPGHTLGHIAYYGQKMLFCGDTLFTGGCGRLFEGTAAQMVQSLNKLMALPEDTAVYCGHEYTETNLKFAFAVEPNNVDLLSRIQKIKSLRASNHSTVPSTLAEEKLTNPFLRCEIRSVITAVEKQVGRKLNDPIEVFAYLREWKNSFS